MRRGVFVLELTLILPIILLTLTILYQVSVMMTSYQVMRTATFNASRAVADVLQNASQNTQNESQLKQELENNVSNVILASVGNCFLGKDLAKDNIKKEIVFASNKTDWENTDAKILYRVLKLKTNQNDSSPNVNWQYCDSLPDGIFAVEVKFQRLDRFTSYWVLPLFVGVEKKNSSIVLSQVAGVKRPGSPKEEGPSQPSSVI